MGVRLSCDHNLIIINRCLLFPRGGLGMRTASRILVEIELGQFCSSLWCYQNTKNIMIKQTNKYR